MKGTVLLAMEQSNVIPYVPLCKRVLSHDYKVCSGPRCESRCRDSRRTQLLVSEQLQAFPEGCCNAILQEKGTKYCIKRCICEATSCIWGLIGQSVPESTCRSRPSFRGFFFDQGPGAANGQTTLGMIIILVKAAAIHPPSASYVDHHRGRQARADAPRYICSRDGMAPGGARHSRQAYSEEYSRIAR